MTATLALYRKATPLLRFCKVEESTVRYWYQIDGRFPNGIGPYLISLSLCDIPCRMMDNITTGTINVNHTNSIELHMH